MFRGIIIAVFVVKSSAESGTCPRSSTRNDTLVVTIFSQAESEIHCQAEITRLSMSLDHA